jgi:hypothetical protein
VYAWDSLLPDKGRSGRVEPVRGSRMNEKLKPESARILCIGGPMDGRWTEDNGRDTLVAWKMEPNSEGRVNERTTEIKGPTRYIYRRKELIISDHVIVIWVIEGMSMAEVISEIIRAYTRY